MEFAIVDIETTGGYPGKYAITEVAIVLMNGAEVQGVYESLVNPQQPIPVFLQRMTGITNEMVSQAPSFENIAENVFNLLKDRVFVAHNVNFDYSFIKHFLQESGFQLQSKKLCTVRLSRRVFKGLSKYSLGNLCSSLGIEIENRHRAGGDALATTKVLQKVIQEYGYSPIEQMLKRENKEQFLPPNLSADTIKKLPYEPGVYYFHDDKGKVIYVGKAKNISYRIHSHFTGLNTGKKRQDFLREIHDIRYKITASEFSALLFESIEIKRLWPKYNISQKFAEQRFCLYAFEDQQGFIRLGIDKRKKILQPLFSFSTITEANRFLWRLVKDFDLHAGLCFLDKSVTALSNLPNQNEYNSRIAIALDSLKDKEISYYIKEPTPFGRSGFIVVEEGKFYGMGFIKDNKQLTDFNAIKKKVVQYPENEFIKSQLMQYVLKNPEAVRLIC